MKNAKKPGTTNTRLDQKRHTAVRILELQHQDVMFQAMLIHTMIGLGLLFICTKSRRLQSNPKLGWSADASYYCHVQSSMERRFTKVGWLGGITCPRPMMTEAPDMNPVMTEWEMKLVIHPKLNNPTSVYMTPAMKATWRGRYIWSNSRDKTYLSGSVGSQQIPFITQDRDSLRSFLVNVWSISRWQPVHTYSLYVCTEFIDELEHSIQVESLTYELCWWDTHWVPETSELKHCQSTTVQS